MSAEPEAISPDELAYLQRAIEQSQIAGQEAQAAGTRAQAKGAALREYAEHLHEKYGLDAKAGDTITEEGVITRHPQEHPGPQ